MTNVMTSEFAKTITDRLSNVRGLSYHMHILMPNLALVDFTYVKNGNIYAFRVEELQGKINVHMILGAFTMGFMNKDESLPALLFDLDTNAQEIANKIKSEFLDAIVKFGDALRTRHEQVDKAFYHTLDDTNKMLEDTGLQAFLDGNATEFSGKIGSAQVDGVYTKDLTNDLGIVRLTIATDSAIARLLLLYLKELSDG